MQATRLKLGALIAGACACSNNADRPASLGPSSNPGVGGSQGTGGGAPAAHHDASDGKDVLTSPTAEGGAADVAAPDDVIFVVHNEAGPPTTECAGDFAALGSNQLLAGGRTPAAFAAAYNAEVMALDSPGPFLLVLTGVNESAPSGWAASLGPLRRTTGGAVSFAGPRATVPFSMSADRAIDIPRIDAAFNLSFSPNGTMPAIAAVSVMMSGRLTNACNSLAQTSIALLVPASASTAPFHGSTVGALMGGPPSEAWQGNPAGAWPLELTGAAQQVYAVGILDAGTEP